MTDLKVGQHIFGYNRWYVVTGTLNAAPVIYELRDQMDGQLYSLHPNDTLTTVCIPLARPSVCSCQDGYTLDGDYICQLCRETAY